MLNSWLSLLCPLLPHHSTFIHLSSHVSMCSSTNCTWALTYSTVEAQKASIISPAHVFEEVEVSQLNAKQDLSGLSLLLRQFSLLLTLFQYWGCGNARHLNHKATAFPNIVRWVSLSHPVNLGQQTESSSVEYRHWCFERSLVTGHYVHWFPEANHPWEPINPRH